MSNFNREAHLRAQAAVDTTIERDLPCRECGYLLRGLHFGHKCPECGTVIEREHIDHSHLMDAPAPYLKTLRIGMGLICLGLWSPVIAVFVAQISSARSMGPFAALAILLAGPILFIIGGWIITRRKPHHAAEKRSLTHIANITRSCLIFVPIIVIGSVLGSNTGIAHVLDALAALGIYGELALISYFLYDLASWAQDQFLARRFEIIIGSFAVIGVIDAIAQLRGSSFGSISCISNLFLVGITIWFLISVIVLFTNLNRAVKDKSVHDHSIFRNPEKKLR